MDKEGINTYIYKKLEETPELLKYELTTNNEPLEYRNSYFKIKKHVDDFLGGYIENRFITLAGLRGVGKTTILLQIYDYLTNEKNINKNRVLYIPADEIEDYIGSNLFEVINTFIEEVHKTSPVSLEKELFILIDEAQYDKNWSKTGKIIYDKTKKIFFIFTGSSALNFEMNVDAVRRIKKESVFPLNFLEYNKLKNKIYPPEDYEKAFINLILNGNETGELNDDILEIMTKKENELRNKLIKKNNSLKKEYEKFLIQGTFPFGLKIKDFEIHRRIYNMIERIIEKDIFSLKSFNTNTRSTISQIITYLALQDPGGTSDIKLATILAKSKKSIREILNTLEKTHLIFSVKPFGGPGKQVRKPWKYFFLSPSINTSIRYRFGKYRKNDRKFLGLLAENYVASFFFKIKETENYYLNIYYDPSENGVDFLLETIDNIIPVEVSIGKKDKKQITKAINQYKSNYGIIISNTTERIKKKKNILYIPLVSVP